MNKDDPNVRELARVIRCEPVKIAHALGFDLLTDIHNEWLKELVFGEKDFTLLGHRGSYKTTIYPIGNSLRMILFPDKTTLFFRKTDADVSEVIRQTSKVLDAPIMHTIAQAIYGYDYRKTKDTDSEINLSLNDGMRGMSQLVGLGIGTSITGKHADLIETDDIVNLKDRTSAAERKQTVINYQELQNIKNRGGRFFNTGTPWHKDDAISTMPNVHKFDCYSTGLITPDELQALRGSMSDSLFAANYELKHIADADALFTSPQYFKEDAKLYGGVQHVDASYSGGDYTAYTAFHFAQDGFIYGFGKLSTKHVDDCLNTFRAAQERFKLGSISCETNGDKGYLLKELNDAGFFAKGYPERENKFIKISTYLRREWPRIKWHVDTDPEYISQILDYTEHAAHDDAPDSAASLIRQETAGARLNRVNGGL